MQILRTYGFVCVEVLRPSQPNGVMSSAVRIYIWYPLHNAPAHKKT